MFLLLIKNLSNQLNEKKNRVHRILRVLLIRQTVNYFVSFVNIIPAL